MANKNSNLSKNNNLKKENLGKYFLYGTAAAIILFFVFSKLNEEKHDENVIKHTWSAEGDSNFVKLCYEKYKPQVKDDMVKQEIMKSFCRCMLEKIKTRYDEVSVNKMSDNDIKQWDAECRSAILNPNQINIK